MSIREKSLRGYLYQIYLYLAFGLLLLFSVFKLGSALWSTMQILIPEYTISGYEWKRTQSLHLFKKHLANREEARADDVPEVDMPVKEIYMRRAQLREEAQIKIKEIWADADKKIEEKWKLERASLLNGELLAGKRGLLWSVIWLLVMLPLLLVHLGLLIRLYKEPINKTV